MPPDAAEPEVVYHYTTMDTMMKIVEKESIWATSISYLNDDSEGEHFQKLIRDRIPEYLSSHKVSNESQKWHKLSSRAILEPFLDQRTRPFEYRPFVASFSQESDSLPQWRSYCPNGNGVAIGFKVDCLKRGSVQTEGNPVSMGMTTKPRITCAPIDYVDSSLIESIDQRIDMALQASNTVAKERRPEGDRVQAPELFRILMEVQAHFIKHASFSNELEYRLLVSAVGLDHHFLGYRPTRSTLVPYVPVHLPRKHSKYREPQMKGRLPQKYWTESERWDFIDRVVIGPTANRDLSVQSVTAFFKTHLMNIEVEHSKVPYRDW